VACVGSPAKTHLAREIAENQDRRLARDSLGLPVYVLVADEVTEDEDRAPLERLHEPQEP
jgi:hypothetical protein